MTRPREFNREIVLGKAIEIFWMRGFSGTSIPGLLGATGLGRQSLYNVFGDKLAVYLEALERYCDEQFESDFRALDKSPVSSFDRVENWLSKRISSDKAIRERGCMATNAITEFGTSNPRVTAVIEKNSVKLHAVLVNCVKESKGWTSSWWSSDSNSTASFLRSVAHGMQVLARNQADPDTLRLIAKSAPRGARL